MHTLIGGLPWGVIDIVIPGAPPQKKKKKKKKRNSRYSRFFRTLL